MTYMNEDAIILKRDGVGRVVTPMARQIELVREFEHSGLSGPKFAALAGVNYQTFTTWRRKHGTLPSSRHKLASQDLALDGRWVEAVVDDQRRVGLTLRLPGGASLDIHRPDQVELAASLLKAITQTPC